MSFKNTLKEFFSSLQSKIKLVVTLTYKYIIYVKTSLESFVNKGGLWSQTAIRETSLKLAITWSEAALLIAQWASFNAGHKLEYPKVSACMSDHYLVKQT